MKERIKQAIQIAMAKLYPEHRDMEFSVDFAPANIDADFASNAAMILGNRLGLKPLELAILLQEKLNSETELEVHVAEPGFLNFKLPSKEWQGELEKILKQGKKYGTSQINEGKKARVEYVSANPTGPIHIGNARGGPYGEVICKVLEATGYVVLREYYHNDAGSQIDKLRSALYFWYLKEQGKIPEGMETEYQGEYVRELAKQAMKKFGKVSEKEFGKVLDFALDQIFKENIQTLANMGIKFRSIVHESRLIATGATGGAIQELIKAGVVKEKGGAYWFTPNDEFFGDKEAVVLRSDDTSTPTYFASDIAYHKEKFTSGYDLVIDILGSNHHGHVPKLQALTRVFDYPPEKFVILLYQYVRVKRGAEVVKMSKRAGTYVTAREVLDEVGRDSMIFTLLMTAINTHVDFDLELAKDTSEKNPVYKVLYAYARCSSILEKAKKIPAQKSLALLKEPLEIGLIKELSKFPEIIEEIAKSYTVHHLPHYLLGLAEKFHKFYEKVRVISENDNLMAARLALISGVKIALTNALKLMGIKPLEKM